MFDMQLAVISDIHGNRWALEAVLEDIDRRGLEKIVNLGDSLYGPLDPPGTADILGKVGMPTVQGNEDRIILDGRGSSADSTTLHYVIESLRPEHFRWLEGLEMTSVAYSTFLLCHGSLRRDDEYLLQHVTDTGLSPRMPHDLMVELSGVQQSVVLCGHDHLPRTVYLPDGRLIVNPGSVGLPAYTDDNPLPHAVENGTPHARYSVISKDNASWHVEDVAVSYDWDRAAEAAMRNARPDWACWLRTGRVDFVEDYPPTDCPCK